MVKQTSSEDRVYAWDDRPDFLPMQVNAWRRLLYPTPALYTASDENKAKPMNDLKESTEDDCGQSQKVANGRMLRKLDQ